jgi:N-acetylmuramoyl-L-alanine amidase
MAGNFLWILDNGHGKATPGKRSPVLEDGRQLLEYEFNRAIVRRLTAKLKAEAIQYHVSVPEIEGDISLAERVRRANNLESALPKLFVSIHGNAQSDNWGTASGIETYYYESSLKGRRMAALFQEHLIETLQWKDRGIKTANFYVIKNTDMPAILTENGFYSNRKECLKMLSAKWREKIAEAHLLAIRDIEKRGVGF